MWKFCTLSLCFCVLILCVLSNDDINSAANTLKFIDEAQSQLELTNKSNIILVLGNSGCGKSTLVHYVAGDNRKILSKPSKNENVSDYEIEDGLDLENGTITSTESRTFLPKLTIDEEQNVWYDCPGFQDTRNENMQIANALLIKNIIKRASSVKLVLAVDYESVTNGHNRNDFDHLLSSTAQLLKKVERFENGVSLVVTKVPSSQIREKTIQVPESSVKNSLAQFMSEHRSDLLRNPMNEKKILLIDFLLKKTGNDYPRISIFWRPNYVGAFATLGKLVLGRHSIRKSVLRNTDYVHVEADDDFGFPLSIEARLRVKNTIVQLDDNISMKLRNVTDQLKNNLRKCIEAEHDFRRKFDRIEMARLRLHSPVRNESFSLRSLIDRYREIIEGSNLQPFDGEEFTQIERDETNLNILKSTLNEEIVHSNQTLKDEAEVDYELFLREISDFFDKCEDEVQSDLSKEAQQKIQNVTFELVNIDTGLLAAINERLKQTQGIHEKLILLRLGEDSVELSWNVTQLGQRMKQFSYLIFAFDITSVSINEIDRIEQHVLLIEKLKSVSKKELNVPVHDFIASSSKTIDLLSTEYDWYSYLITIYDFLAGYEVQRNVDAYNVADLSNWGKPDKPQGLLITPRNFNEFTRLFTKSEFESTSSHLNDLNVIIETTLKSPPKYHCSDQTITIEGNFVRSSDIQVSKFPSIQTLTRVNVFVVDRFYVDSDLDLNGFENLDLHILANTWTVIQPATFRLNGLNGTSETNPPMMSGRAGQPGDPGMNSGNFFGLANEIENGEQLTVELIGGNGANGQDGSGNEDVEVAVKKKDSENPRFLYVYYLHPTDHYIKNVKFESRGCVREFDGWDPTYMNSTLTNLLGKMIKYTRKIFPGHCCGVTGTGGFGGHGGMSGYYEFALTGNNTANLPKKIQMNGANGMNGDNGRVCKTAGLADHMSCIYKGFNEDGFLIFDDNEVKTYETIEDPHCPDKYTSSEEREILQNPPRELYITRTTIEYKRFLRKHIGNPMFHKIIQNTLI